MSILIHPCRSVRWLLFAMVFGVGIHAATAETLSAPEYKIKAAFLYNFGVLTEWPTNAFKSDATPLIIGVLGKDPFGRILEETMKGKKIQGRKIKIERFSKADHQGITETHMLFIAASEEARVEKIILSLAKRPILTITETSRFNHHGGMIWVQKRGDQIEFGIRHEVAREAGLDFSSKLLALAVNSVSRKNGEGK